MSSTTRTSLPDPLALEVNAEPPQLHGLRDRLAEWLRAIVPSSELIDRIVLAMNEAVTNAVTHAYRGSAPGSVRVTADVTPDDILCVSVADQGTWRPARPTEGIGGRGVLMMQECVDRVLIERTSRGTTVTLHAGLRQPSLEPDGDQPTGDARHQVEVRRRGSTMLAQVSGTVRDGSSALLRRQLLTATCGGVVPLFVDLGEVDEVTESLVEALSDVVRAADGAGERVVLIAPPGSPATAPPTHDALTAITDVVRGAGGIG